MWSLTHPKDNLKSELTANHCTVLPGTGAALCRLAGSRYALSRGHRRSAALWTRPLGRRIFRLTPELAEATRGLAANQGLYNLFLSAGLAWSLFAATEFVRPLQIFFLGCVLLAGVFGAFTVSIRILFVQAVPAAVALALIFF